MTYQINPYVEQQNHLRCHTPEQRYMQQLEARGLLLRLDNVMVDAEQMVLRTFQCDTGWCMRCSQEGNVTKYKGSCCTDLEVDVTSEEIRRIRELGAIAQEKLGLSPRDPLTRIIDRINRDEFTEVTDKGEVAFRHISSGRCALSWVTPGGALRCGLNSLCMALELPLTEYKPDPCYLFPLHYVQPLPGAFFVTLISKETFQAVGADQYVTKLRCLARPQPGSPSAYQFLRNEIIHCFGRNFYDALDAAAQPILERGLPASAAANGRNGSVR